MCEWCMRYLILLTLLLTGCEKFDKCDFDNGKRALFGKPLVDCSIKVTPPIIVNKQNYINNLLQCTIDVKIDDVKKVVLELHIEKQPRQIRVQIARYIIESMVLNCITKKMINER